MVSAWQLGSSRPHIQFRNLGRSRAKGVSMSFRPFRNPMVVVMCMLCLILWSRHAGLFASFSEFTAASDSSSDSASSSIFSHGSTKVDSVLEFEGDGRTTRSATINKDEASTSMSASKPKKRNEIDPKAGREGSEVNPDRAIVHDSDDSSALPASRKEDQNVSSGTSENIAKQQTDLKPKTVNEEAIEPQSKREVSLREVLNFTEKTAINFMHFHKTGGVSFKTSLHKFYFKKNKRNGDRVVTRDACYVRENAQDEEGQPTFLMWRCDWNPIREMDEEDRNKHDFVFGHQFWADGVAELLNKRDLRTFTILRHPFDRKVSFYYHFFVREVGRKEEDVSFEEIREFLLYDRLRIDADLGRDLGPNYMAGRLLSNGKDGFVGNSSHSYFHVDGNEREITRKALRLIRDYVFVGLLEESAASQCMLRKVIETFNEVNGISNDGAEQIDEKVDRLNGGSYSLSAKDIWSRFSDDDRVVFDKKEQVDLSIYAEGERLFREQVKHFGCSHRLAYLS